MEKMISTEDSVIIWTETFGKSTDPTVLLIMGAMNQGIFWPDEFCQTLANEGNFVIRYDHRDTGKSSIIDFERHPYSLDTLTRDAVEVLKGHGVEKAVIVGLSMGGYIAQLIAIQHPDLVDKLVLISTTADQRPYMTATMGIDGERFDLPPPDEKLLAYIRSTVSAPPKTESELEDNMLQGWAVTYGGARPFPRKQVANALRLSASRTKDRTANFHHALAVAASPERLESVKRIQAPTLIIHGRYDVCFPLSHAEYLSHSIPKAQLFVLEMGHAFMWSWSIEVAALISRFTSETNTDRTM
ncbi:MAG: alpha/beta fold hydrolase [Sideroxydans sp.]|jgi:pimeloyl-ACP methyl ester carboxylesterase